MEKTCLINSKTIAYTEVGSGPALVLLHGYLETKEVWTDFANKLSADFQVISIDIPGHGKSEFINEIHTMELLAHTINELLIRLNIETCTMVGHSMGGYVMLAFAELYPEKLTNFVLFHSSVYADTDEKRKNREREIDFILQGKLELIANSNLPNTFANDNVEKFTQELDEMKWHAKHHNQEGVCAILRGMMARPDRQELIKSFAKPMLFIFGKKDNYISVEAAEKMLALNSAIKVVWLKNSGHMGFIEEETIALKIMLDFIQ